MIEELDLLAEKLNNLLSQMKDAKARIQKLEDEKADLELQLEEARQESGDKESLETSKQELESKVSNLEKEVSDFSGRESVVKNKLHNIIDKLDSIEDGIEEFKQGES